MCCCCCCCLLSFPCLLVACCCTRKICPLPTCRLLAVRVYYGDDDVPRMYHLQLGAKSSYTSLVLMLGFEIETIYMPSGILSPESGIQNDFISRHRGHVRLSKSQITTFFATASHVQTPNHPLSSTLCRIDSWRVHSRKTIAVVRTAIEMTDYGGELLRRQLAGTTWGR